MYNFYLFAGSFFIQKLKIMNLKTYTSIRIPQLERKMDINCPVLLMGSCFSENIANRLSNRKWKVLSNPFGILFDALSIERTLEEIVQRKEYTANDLFLYNELYTSWNHHSDYSDYSMERGLKMINDSMETSYKFLEDTNTVIITLGSAYSYYYHRENKYVANCHKIPQLEFRKDLISIERILLSLKKIRSLILSVNPTCNFILTISPVRHLRDGVVENNRSKARLIEAVNLLIEEFPAVYYFPSYEIVIDVLRDYRFFDIDCAHPNYLATDIVFDYFKESCIDENSYESMERFYELHLAMKHRSKNPETTAHKKFLANYLEKAREFQKQFPNIDFSKEISHFKEALAKN
jgi:hypothetical protein